MRLINAKHRLNETYVRYKMSIADFLGPIFFWMLLPTKKSRSFRNGIFIVFIFLLDYLHSTLWHFRHVFHHFCRSSWI